MNVLVGRSSENHLIHLPHVRRTFQHLIRSAMALSSWVLKTSEDGVSLSVLVLLLVKVFFLIPSCILLHWTFLLLPLAKLFAIIKRIFCHLCICPSNSCRVLLGHTIFSSLPRQRDFSPRMWGATPLAPFHLLTILLDYLVSQHPFWARECVKQITIFPVWPH